MDELNGRVLACQIVVTGLIARFASERSDSVDFLSTFREQVQAAVAGLRITGHGDVEPLRAAARKMVDELFSLMKPPQGASD